MKETSLLPGIAEPRRWSYYCCCTSGRLAAAANERRSEKALLELGDTSSHYNTTMRARRMRGVSRNTGRRRTVLMLSVLAAMLLCIAVGWQVVAPGRSIPQRSSAAGVVVPRNVPPLTDHQLQTAADGLLAAVDPAKPQNQYFPEFAREKLAWMLREHTIGRLDVAFFNNTATVELPADVLMAAWRRDGTATIFISKRRFEQFLLAGGATTPPFTQQQKNDFALALVHEVVHLQNPDANPRDPEMRVQEESRAWKAVTVEVVRDLVATNQPLDQRFRDVDAALRACNDQLPCPSLARLVRLGL